MKMKENSDEKLMEAVDAHELSRRGFLKIVGVFTISAAGVGLASCQSDVIPVSDLSAPASLSKCCWY